MYSPYSVADIKQLCAHHRIRPSKDRGQNFLIDEAIADAVAAAAQLTRHDEVIEVGSGFGALTFKLAERAKRVTAIEIEPKLAQCMREECERRGLGNIETVEGDFFIFLSGSPIKSGMTLKNSILVSSLPYSITSDFFSSVLCDERLPKALTLVVQKEVAERMAARPPLMSLLAVVVQWFGSVTVVQRVPRSAFWPQPEVDSALVIIDTTDAGMQARREGIDSTSFFEFVRRAYRHPRKKIVNTLNLDISKYRYIEISNRRPGEITVDEWIFLYNVYQKL